MVDHIKTHSNDLPYTCKFCSKRFSLQGNCVRHEKNYTCLSLATKARIKKGDIFIVLRDCDVLGDSQMFKLR